MGFNNPSMPWSELERRLSGRRPTDAGRARHRSPTAATARPGRTSASPSSPPITERVRGAVPYAELHCHSNFSFLDGARHPEELAEEAARLGLEALALTDHDGFYGVVRFAEAARAVGLPTVFGAELSLGLTKPQNGEPDPEGEHLLVLARDPDGYARLAATISAAQIAGEEKGKPDYRASVGRGARRSLAGAHRVPQGRGAARAGRARSGRGAAASSTGWSSCSVVTTSRSSCGTTATRSTPPATTRSPRSPCRAGVDVVATNNVHYAHPSRRRLATALAAVRARRSLDEIDGWLPGGAGAHLRAGAEQARRFARYPGAVERAAELGLACAFDLQLVAPDLPPFPCPDGLDEMQYLRCLTEEGALRRYGPRGNETVPGAWAQIDHELDLIEPLGFPGYFLVVWDIVEFCRRSNILCQGRGSRRTSAVCYALGITNADAVELGLLFERFLSPERDGPPDIDIDIESDRREEAIQYVYERTAAATRRRSPTSSPTAPSRRSATWPRRSATPPVSRTRGPSRSTRGGRSPPPRGCPITRSPRPSSSSRPRSSTSPATSASTRAAWSSATGRSSRCARSSGAAWRTAASCSGTRTTAPRSAW